MPAKRVVHRAMVVAAQPHRIRQRILRFGARLAHRNGRDARDPSMKAPAVTVGWRVTGWVAQLMILTLDMLGAHAAKPTQISCIGFYESVGARIAEGRV